MGQEVSVGGGNMSVCLYVIGVVASLPRAVCTFAHGMRLVRGPELAIRHRTKAQKKRRKKGTKAEVSKGELVSFGPLARRLSASSLPFLFHTARGPAGVRGVTPSKASLESPV